MAIKSIYRKYFQKSRIFLYPLLDIENNSSIMPRDTFVSWTDNYNTNDKKLICIYNIRKDSEFIKFEKNRLFNNKLFYEFKHLDKERGAYVFDLKSHEKDFINFINGKYSNFSDKLKDKVLNYYSPNNTTKSTIESYLKPTEYYETYSELLGVSISLLKQSIELCDKPDLIKENCNEVITNLELKIQL